MALALVSDSGQRYGGNTEIGSYVMLRNALYNIKMLFQQFLVSLSWRVLYTRKE